MNSSKDEVLNLASKLRKHAQIADATGRPHCNLLIEAADNIESLLASKQAQQETATGETREQLGKRLIAEVVAEEQEGLFAAMRSEVAKRNRDQAVTPEYAAWLDEQAKQGIEAHGGNEIWNAATKAALQPAQTAPAVSEHVKKALEKVQGMVEFTKPLSNFAGYTRLAQSPTELICTAQEVAALLTEALTRPAQGAAPSQEVRRAIADAHREWEADRAVCLKLLERENAELQSQLSTARAEGWSVAIDLDEEQSKCLRDYIDGSFDERPVSLIVSDGRCGYGLYAYDTEYPDEPAEFIRALRHPEQPADKPRFSQRHFASLLEGIAERNTSLTGQERGHLMDVAAYILGSKPAAQIDSKDAVIQQMLDALENHAGNYKLTKTEAATINAAMDAGRAALAQQAGKERGNG